MTFGKCGCDSFRDRGVKVSCLRGKKYIYNRSDFVSVQTQESFMVLDRPLIFLKENELAIARCPLNTLVKYYLVWHLSYFFLKPYNIFYLLKKFSLNILIRLS